MIKTIKRFEAIRYRVQQVRIEMAESNDHGYTDELLTGFMAGLEHDLGLGIKELMGKAFTDSQIESHIMNASRTRDGQFGTTEALTALAMIFHNRFKED